MSENKNQSSGIGFFSLLCLLFIGLKLTGFVDWPWWVVLSPLWGKFALMLLFLLIALLADHIKD